MTRATGEAKGSLAASKDPKVRAAIRRGRRKARLDQAVVELWAANDFESGGLQGDVSYGRVETKGEET